MIPNVIRFFSSALIRDFASRSSALSRRNVANPIAEKEATRTNKPKKLTNIRTTSSDGLTQLYGTKKMSLEKCIEWIDDDEWIEVTPKSIRLRKKVLPANLRSVRKVDKE